MEQGKRDRGEKKKKKKKKLVLHATFSLVFLHLSARETPHNASGLRLSYVTFER